ncbi:MAG TPA: long-chain fatty acid--CoA ligase [Dehalococcoidia bacterium]|nr:long-chain fatty acid--CoA ligase [Dehalococcoidia bacterium]
MNLKSVLERTASRYGDKDAIVYGDRRVTYTSLDKESNRFASALIKAGIVSGDRVALFLSNSPEFFIAFFGITKIGAVPLPLDQQYKLREMKSLFGNSFPAAIVSEKTALDVLSPIISDIKSVNLVIEAGQERTGHFTGFGEFLDSGSDEYLNVERSPDDIAVIMYTSASSFQPKGVMLSHYSLVKEAIMSSDGYAQTDKDIMMLFALPMFHVYGLVAAALSTIHTGGTIVLVPGTGLSIKSFLSAIEREKGTMFLGVPYIFALAVDIAKNEGIQDDLSSLRLCASAGAPLSTNTAREFKQLFGLDIMDCYGLTEAVCHVTCPPIGETVKMGSIGKPLSGWNIKIVDTTGTEVSAGESGEILVNGPIMKGFFNNPEDTEKFIKNRWLYTGDIGMKDKDGYLYITGRSKDTIIVKGQNIYPADVESVIAEMPEVAEVAVMGIPDRMRGEIIGAVINLHENVVLTEQEIRQFCLDRIASYKIPKQIIFSESMPRNESGKIDKDIVRQQLSIPPVFPVLWTEIFGNL